MGPPPLLQNSSTSHLPPQATSSLSCSCLLNLRKPLPSFRHACHQISWESMHKFTLCVRSRSSLINPPAIITEKGDSISRQNGFCKVIWIIEADMADDDLLYLIGESEALGSWNPEMAILMSPTESANLWKAEALIDYGVNVKYNYLMKKETWPTSDIVWRPGPEFSLSVPTLQVQDREVVVRDLWMRFSSKSPFDHMWTSWMDEGYLRTPLLTPAARNEGERMHCHNEDQLHTKLLLTDSILKDISSCIDEDIVCGIADESQNDTTYSVRYQPLEEPWLLVSNVSAPYSEDDEISNAPNLEAHLLTEVHEAEVQQHQQIIEKLLPEKEISLISNKDLVSTIILINSSLCTMQRIAVLEDEELVELLLEPVKSDVQCDSVYLGVVTKLVPHMGGAFVNIGCSRPSLMDIKRIREPFIFPPFRRKGKEKFLNGEKESTLHEDVDAVVDLTDEAFEEDSSTSFHDYDEEHEIEDEFDAPDVLGNKTNGSLIYHGEQETGGEASVDSLEKQLEGENVVANNYSHESDVFNLQHPESTKKKFSGENKWAQVQKGTKVVVQVVKEGLGTKGPTLTAYPKLRSRFWILLTRCNRVGVSKKISGVERTRLKVIAKTLQPRGFGLTVRTVASGHSLEELQKDLEGLLSTWENIMEHAKSAALAADEGVEGAIPVILHRAMGQTLSVVQDYFTDKVKRFVVDSARTYHEVTNYLQDIAPDLCNRVELYNERVPLFDKFKIEEEINNILSKRVPLANGGSLVIEQTEALVSIDVNGGHGMLGQGTSQEKAVLEVNLAAAKQIARELRLRDIGGIIVVDFIDMIDDANKRLVYEEVKKAVERDRSMVKVSELSRHGLMEITRKRVRPSVTFMISEPCSCCHATGRVEALETSFAKIEQEICRLLAMMDQNANSEDPKSWPRFILMVDHIMCNYLTSGKRTKLATLTSSLKVWILLKVNRGFTRGAFDVKPFSDDKANKTQQISVLRPTDGGTYSPTRNVTLIPVKKWKARNK